MTMDFTNKWTKIEERAKSLLEQITGTAVVEYTTSKMIITDIPIKQISINGKQSEWHGLNQTIEYNLLGCTDDSVAIKYSLFGYDFIEQMYFINEDTYWIYSGSAKLTENSHTREFFVRVKPIKSGKTNE